MRAGPTRGGYCNHQSGGGARAARRLSIDGYGRIRVASSLVRRAGGPSARARVRVGAVGLTTIDTGEYGSRVRASTVDASAECGLRWKF